MEEAWRTLSIEHAEKLRLRDGCLLAETEDSTFQIPLGELRTILLNSQRSTISAALLAELCRRQISVILCDRKRTPVGEIVCFSGHSQAAGRLEDQCSWKAERKEELWQKIIVNKLKQQRELLRICGRAIPAGLDACISSVQPGDASLREAVGASLYFEALFGSDFRRHTEDEVNSALNYGYAILRSALNRLLAIHGYHTALGVRHCSRNNYFNLSCDLMEPFRPFVDRVVADASGEMEDRDYRPDMVSVLNEPVRYGTASLPLYTAMERYLLAAAAFLNGEADTMEEVRFERG